MTHLLVALSSHGFGHAAQAAAVVNALRRRFPDWRLTLRTLLPREILAALYEGEFSYTACETDVGMLMKSALDMDIPATGEAYARFHADWDRRVRDEAEALLCLAPDRILSDVPYLTLAAAARAGIPAVAMCSLNWADIYAHYFHDTRAEASVIHAQILEAYHQADCFLQPEPSMPMADLPRRAPIGPVAQVGSDRSRELKAGLGLHPATRLVAIALGGIELRLPLESWPPLPSVHWLVPAAWGIAGRDATPMQSLGVGFTDLLCSVDALIGKPGYGTFTQAACNGTPVLYVRRAGWPEEPWLIRWLKRYGNCLEIEREQLFRGDVADALDQLWDMPARSPVAPSGIAEALELLSRR